MTKTRTLRTPWYDKTVKALQLAGMSGLSLVVVNALRGFDGHVPRFVAPEKQPPAGSACFPICSQNFQHGFSEDRVSIFLALALFDPDHHSVAFDMLGFQSDRFGNPEPAAVNGFEQRPVLDVRGRFDDAKNFPPAQNHWYFANSRPRRDMKGGFAPLKNIEIKRSDARKRHVAGTPSQPTVFDEMSQVGLDFFVVEQIRRLAVISSQVRDRPNVGFLRFRRKPPQRHEISETGPQFACHDDASFGSID